MRGVTYDPISHNFSIVVTPHTLVIQNHNIFIYSIFDLVPSLMSTDKVIYFPLRNVPTYMKDEILTEINISNFSH